MNINEMLKEVNYQRQAVWIDAMPSLLQSLETAYPIPLGGRCLPVAARLLLMDLTSEANAESDR
jgi:hypothetical protein